MTNKVKPFYIRIADDMTPQMVQDAFDKCHNLGVRASNSDDVEDLFDWGYFGVCGRDGTYFSDSYRGFYDATEITLDQLDEWLGLEVEQGWDGEGLPPVGAECEWKGKRGGYWVPCIVVANNDKTVVVQNTGNYKQSEFEIIDLNYQELRKPETLEQKAERERLEEQEEARKNALAMLEEVSDVKNANVNIDCTYAIAATVKAMIDLGYRKQ